MEIDVNLDTIKEAAQAAFEMYADADINDVALAAASALSPDASDFDRGMAAGFAVASVLSLQDNISKQYFPRKSASG